MFAWGWGQKGKGSHNWTSGVMEKYRSTFTLLFSLGNVTPVVRVTGHCCCWGLELLFYAIFCLWVFFVYMWFFFWFFFVCLFVFLFFVFVDVVFVVVVVVVVVVGRLLITASISSGDL